MKTLATAIFGETVVNTVISGAKSVARAIRTAVQPIVDTVSTAWNKATQMYREAQEEISRLDKTAPDYHLQVDAIYRSACARYMGVEEEKDEPVVSEQQIYTVEKGMVLPTSRNSLGRAVLPAGTYTQQEIVDFIIKYGEPALVRTTLDLVSTGSMTYKFPDGSIRTVTTAQGLQNVIDAHRDQSVIQSWELSVGDEISMLLREHKGHPEKAFELVYQYTLQPHVDRYIRIVHSENLLKLASNLENFIMFGMVDDAKLLLFGDSMATQIGAGGNLLLKAFSFGGGWSVVLKDGSIVTSQDLIRWADRYGGLPRGQVPAGTFDEAFKNSDDKIIINEKPNSAFSNEIGLILDKRIELTGTTREKLLTTTTNTELRGIINQLYREGATVGDGGTAAILVEEFNNGISTHLTKATERLIQLNRLISSGTLGSNDLDIAIALRDDLQYAIGLFD